MKLKPPSFFTKRNLASVSLLPLSLIYNVVAATYNFFKSFKKKPKETHAAKVIVVGNIVVGGGGKTPSCIMICKMLQSAGYTCCFVSNGYGSNIGKSEIIKINESHFEENKYNFDESLLLAEHADTFVCKQRRLVIEDICNNYGYNFIICDDGLQDASVNASLYIACFSGRYPVGNGFTLPAGPLRPLYKSALRKSQIWLVKDSKSEDFNLFYNGGYHEKNYTKRHVYFTKTVFEFSEKLKTLLNKSKDCKFVAFAGIANNKSFFRSLKDLGLNIQKKIELEDHAHFSKSRVKMLLKFSKNAELITSKKNWLKLPAELKDICHWTNTAIECDDAKELLEKCLSTLSE